MDFLRITVREETVAVGATAFLRSPSLTATAFDYELDQLKRASSPGELLTEAPPEITLAFLMAFGHKLWHSLLPTEAARAAAGGEAGLALDLPPDLAALPWELLHDDGEYLALSRGIVRVAAGSGVLRAGLARGLLAAMAMPVLDTEEPVDSDNQPYVADVRAHANLLRDSARDCALPMTICRHVTPSLFREALGRMQPGVVYLLAHGSPRSLLFESEDWTCQSVPRADVIRWLNRSGTQVVVLNSCLTAAQVGQANALAANLVEAGVPVAIGMQLPLSLSAAEVLAPALLGRLCPGRDLADMLIAAREDLYEAAGSKARPWEFATPVMFVSSELLASDAATTLRDEPTPERPALADLEGDRALVLTNPPPRFVGRRRELVALARRLRDHRLTILHGARGVGKTTLVQEAARRGARDFSRIVWVSAQVHEVAADLESQRAGSRIADRPGDATDVIVRLAKDLGSALPPGAPLPDLLRECARLAAADRPLIVLDNLDTVVDDPAIRQLLVDLPDNARVVATCFREPEGTWPCVPVPELSLPDGVVLVLTEAERNGLSLTLGDLNDLLRTLGTNPLGIRLVLAQAAEPGETLGRVLAGAKAHDGPLLDYVVSESLRLAGEEAHGLLALASVFGLPVTRPLLAQASALSVQSSDVALRRLTRLSLIDMVGDTVQVRELIRLGALASASPEALAELVNQVLRVTGLAPPELLCAAAAQLEALCRERGAVQAWLPLGRAAVARARAAQDDRLLSGACSGLGIGLTLTGLPEEALRCHQQAYEIDLKLGDPQGEAADLGNMGNIYADQGQPEEALRCYREAYDIAEGLGNPQLMANQLGNMGNIYARQGQPEEALRCYRQAYDIAERLGNPQTMGNQLGNMGLIYADQGQPEEALRCFREAYDIAEPLGNPQLMANQLGNMGIIYADQGQPEEALRCYRQAYDIAEPLGNPQLMANQLGNMGLIYADQGQPEEARDHLRRALALYDRCGYRGPGRQIVEDALAALQ